MNPIDLEQIVAEVVRRLTAVVGNASSSTQAEGPKQPTISLAALGRTSGMPVALAKSKRAESSNEVFNSEERLLTLATLDGKLEGLRRLVVHRKAIVTPALREELSRRGIELDRGGLKGTKKAEVAIAVVRFNAEHAPSLPGLGLAEDVSVKSVGSLVKKVKEQLDQADRMVVVLTRQASVALCVLNRISTVRAALATNVESVRGAVKAIAANVLIVDPAHLGRVQLSALLRACENEGVRPVPSELSEVLSNGK